MKILTGFSIVALNALFFTSNVFAEQAVATLHGTQEGSTLSGQAVFRDTDTGLHILIHIEGAPPGRHGIHVHEFGSCENGGKAAGGHFNPDGVEHGFFPESGPEHAHAGDLGNIEIGPDGTGDLEHSADLLSVSYGPYSVAGRAVILHAKPDDFGQPTGNAGSRIGCGTIVITSK